MADMLQQRLDFIGLGEGIEARLAPIVDSVAQHLDLALQRLAMQVAGAPSAARFLFGRERIEADNGGPAAHWRALAAGQFDSGFAEAAQRAGHRQARIGVDPRWHAGSHAIVVQSLVRGVIRDGVEAAMRARRGPLALLGGGDPAPALALTEAMADGLAALVGAVVLDLDLTFSGYAERLRLDAAAAVAAEKNRLKQVVAEAGRILEQAAQGRRDLDRGDLSDPDLAPLHAGAERLADRMIELVGDLDVSGRAVRTLAAEVLRCTQLLNTDAAGPLSEAASCLAAGTTAMTGTVSELARAARASRRRIAKARTDIAAVRRALDAEAVLDTALALIERLGAEQGDLARSLAGLEREAQRLTSLAADLQAELEARSGQQAAVDQRLRVALEGAEALVGLAQAMGGGAGDSDPSENAIPAPENAALAAHWHML